MFFDRIFFFNKFTIEKRKLTRRSLCHILFCVKTTHFLCLRQYIIIRWNVGSRPDARFWLKITWSGWFFSYAPDDSIMARIGKKLFSSSPNFRVPTPRDIVYKSNPFIMHAAVRGVRINEIITKLTSRIYTAHTVERISKKKYNRPNIVCICIIF